MYTHRIAVAQVNRLVAAHHIGQVKFQILALTVLVALHLNVIHVGVVNQASGILDQLLKALTLNHLVTHRAVNGAAYAYNVLCYGHKQHIAVLQVILNLGVGIGHICVQVQTAGLAAAAQLNVTDRTNLARTAGSCNGVEYRIQS